jgi:hypothetical protein
MIARTSGEQIPKAGTYPAQRPSGPAWAASPLVRLGGAARLAPRCPHCNSIVYSRRNRLCGVCSRELPDAFRFSEAEAQRIVRLLTVERERHRRWISKRFLEAVSVL